MKKTINNLILIVILSFCSCEFSTNSDSGNKTAENLKVVSESKELIRNSIGLEEQGGLEVINAFLMTDDGHLVPENNTLKQGSRIKLVLKLTGWLATDNKVEIGAGQQLLNSNHVVMMRNNDLFENTTVVSLEDAEVITLIMEVLNTEIIYDYYQTDFKIWNKRANQMIRGSYQFKLEK